MISHVVITTLCDQMYLIGGMNDQSDYNDVWVLTSECELCTILFTAYLLFIVIHSYSGQVSYVMSYDIMVDHVSCPHSYEPCTAPRTSYDLPIPIPAPRKSVSAAPPKVS